MKITSTFRANFIYVVAMLHILLFTYAAVSKVLDFQNFRIQLGQSPLLTVYAGFISYFIPSLEIALSIGLMLPRCRKAVISASCFLMFLFTVYIVMILNFTSYIPCSCGGVLEKLGWTEHLVLNAVFVLLGLLAIWIESDLKHTVIVSAIGGTIAVALMSLLFLLSEDEMQNENPFIRRFPQGSAAQVAQIDLKNTDFYIAGADDKHIYLGNYKAQLQITIIDKGLKTKSQRSIQLQSENPNIRSITISVQGNKFYAYDGVAPVIYSGSISDWKAKVLTENKYAFNDISFINDSTVVIRGQPPNVPDNILARVTGTRNPKFLINDRLLQKQVNGLFDTDGTLAYSQDADKIVYTYFYRNQYIVADRNLKLLHRGNTIDTTTRARIKVAKVAKSGDSKFSAPPLYVNKHTSVTANLLFVNSMLRGRFETDQVWKHATVIDVYNFLNKKYLLSFYVHDYDGYRMNFLYAAEDAVYIISGRYLLKYGYGDRIGSKLEYKDLPAGNR